MAHGTFGTALNCMDGRAQGIVEQIVKDATGAEFVDAITEPGIDKILGKQADAAKVADVKMKTGISVDLHHSNFIAVAGHDECAGNPVDEATHKAEIKAAVGLVKSWVGEDVTVVGLWLNKDFNAEVVVGSDEHDLQAGRPIRRNEVSILPPDSVLQQPKKQRDKL